MNSNSMLSATKQISWGLDPWKRNGQEVVPQVLTQAFTHTQNTYTRNTCTQTNSNITNVSKINNKSRNEMKTHQKNNIITNKAKSMPATKFRLTSGMVFRVKILSVCCRCSNLEGSGFVLLLLIQLWRHWVCFPQRIYPAFRYAHGNTDFYIGIPTS